MSTSFDLPNLDHFITGTVGEPGARVFYIQAVTDNQVFTLRLEKLQVAALAQYLAAIIGDVTNMSDLSEIKTTDNIELIQPVVPEWVIGQINVTYDEIAKRIVVIAEEMPELSDDEVVDPDDFDGATASFRLTPEQVAAFIYQASMEVAAGRPPCMLCGRPIDPEGHVCIKTNGHKPH